MNTDTFTFATDQAPNIAQPFNWSRVPSSDRIGTWTDAKNNKHWCVYISDNDTPAEFGIDITREMFVRSINDYTNKIDSLKLKQLRKNVVYYSLLCIPLLFFIYNVAKGGH